MMGRKQRDQASFFYEFRLDDMIPENHLLRRINVFVTVGARRPARAVGPILQRHRPSFDRSRVDDPDAHRRLLLRHPLGERSCARKSSCIWLTAGSASSISMTRFPHHSTFSENRLGRFRESDLLRHIFERVVLAAMAMGLVKGEGFAVDASVMEANASRYHGKAPDELDWTEKQRQKRAVAEYLAALDAEAAAEGEAPNDRASGGPERKRQRRMSASRRR